MPARTRLPARPKPQSAGAGLLARAGVGSMLELSLLNRILRTGLPGPETQQPFDPTRKWEVDFMWRHQRLIVEVEGGIFSKGGESGAPCPLCKQRKRGAHGSVSGILRDIEKYNAATLLGWRVLRVTGKQIESGEAVRIIAQALAEPPPEANDDE